MMDDSFIIVEVMLWLIYIVCAVALAVVVWSVVRTLRNHSKSGIINGIRSSLLAWSVTAVLFLSLIITWATGSTKPMMVNGELYEDALWLRLSDMFVNTIIIMLVVAIAVVLFGFTRYYRRKGKEASE